MRTKIPRSTLKAVHYFLTACCLIFLLKSAASAQEWGAMNLDKWAQINVTDMNGVEKTLYVWYDTLREQKQGAINIYEFIEDDGSNFVIKCSHPNCQDEHDRPERYYKAYASSAKATVSLDEVNQKFVRLEWPTNKNFDQYQGFGPADKMPLWQRMTNDHDPLIAVRNAGAAAEPDPTPFPEIEWLPSVSPPLEGAIGDWSTPTAIIGRGCLPMELMLGNGTFTDARLWPVWDEDPLWQAVRGGRDEEKAKLLLERRQKIFAFVEMIVPNIKKNLKKSPKQFSKLEGDLLWWLMEHARGIYTKEEAKGWTADSPIYSIQGGWHEDIKSSLRPPEKLEKFVAKWRKFLLSELVLYHDQYQAALKDPKEMQKFKDRAFEFRDRMMKTIANDPKELEAMEERAGKAPDSSGPAPKEEKKISEKKIDKIREELEQRGKD